MTKLNKKDCEMQTCKFSDIRHIFEDFHYKKGHMGGGISVCFAMLIDDKLVGGSVLGNQDTKVNTTIVLTSEEWHV